MRISTTTLDKFHLADTAPTAALRERFTAELIDQIRGAFTETPSLLLGRAYDAILCNPDRYRTERGYAYGQYRFEADTIDPAIATIDYRGLFQVKSTRAYGLHTVVAKVDHVLGSDVTEFKTRIGTVRLDRYASSYQWRFELDVLGAATVTYRVFRLSQDPYALEQIEELPLFGYPRLHDDCCDPVAGFVAFVRRHRLEGFLPDQATHEERFEDSPTRKARPRPNLREVPLPMRIAPLAPAQPVADLPPATYSLRTVTGATPRQASLF